MRSRARVLLSLILNQTNGKCLIKSILIPVVYNALLVQQCWVGERRFTLIPQRFLRVWNKVQNMHAWFFSCPSAPLMRHWMVEFILISPCAKFFNTKTKKSQKNLPVFPSQLSILIWVQDWIVGFILIRDVSLLLQHVGYAMVKNQSKQNALFLLKRVGYATIKNQIKQDASLLLKFKCHWKNCKQTLVCVQQVGIQTRRLSWCLHLSKTSTQQVQASRIFLPQSPSTMDVPSWLLRPLLSTQRISKYHSLLLIDK